MASGLEANFRFLRSTVNYNVFEVIQGDKRYTMHLPRYLTPGYSMEGYYAVGEHFIEEEKDREIRELKTRIQTLENKLQKIKDFAQ